MSLRDNKQSQTIALCGRIVHNGTRRFLSIPSDYNAKIDELPSRRVLITLQALP